MTPIPINDRDTARTRCASERNPDYPLWFVERNGPNVAWCEFGPKFVSRAECEAEAKRLNGEKA